MITRRGFVGGLVALLAAPAIVRVSSLMQLRSTPIVVPRWRITYQGRAIHAVGGLQDALKIIDETREIIAADCFFGEVTVPSNLKGLRALSPPPNVISAVFEWGSTELTAKRAELRRFALA